MDKLFELGFVCQCILKAGEVVFVCVRDVRNGQLLSVGTSSDDLIHSLLCCIEKAELSMDAQVKAMDNA